MKKLLVLLFIFLGSLQMTAQDRDSHRERIKALKTAYITEGLSLTSQEAEKFWPVYNKYEKKRRDLHRRERREVDDIDIECITEEEASGIVKEYVQIEREDYLIKKQFFQEMSKILSAKRIIQLREVEDDFNRKLLKEYRERHSKDVQ